ncbi:hypothetical protein DS745_02940 [Anaerobacillus alkaliphilus]|uniref:DUF4179 domain-containing protein n=1 Tax=Anaerobacillus alkaliphilus TaxID=1548597 RepID=A0A4Q0VYX0_9BACI|nr:hypothetical protein [Anaerobacillus alkaliphilus]RXJ04356.1 hypothetical protein DS745_02940 [Anaerobacillus alkaliphilus]
MNCPIGKRKLEDYHKGNLSFADYKATNEHLATCEVCATKLDAIINKTDQEANSTKSPKWLRSALLFSLIVLCIIVAIYSGYLALFKDEPEVVTIEVVAEEVDLEVEEDHHIDFTITHADVGDRIIVYFEIRDLNQEHNYFFEHYRFSYRDSMIGPFTASEDILMEIEPGGVSKGELHLLPLLGNEDEIIIQLYELFRINNNEIEPFSKEWFAKENRTYLHGEWEFNFLIQKDQSLTFSNKVED